MAAKRRARLARRVARARAGRRGDRRPIARDCDRHVLVHGPHRGPLCIEGGVAAIGARQRAIQRLGGGGCRRRCDREHGGRKCGHPAPVMRTQSSHACLPIGDGVAKATVFPLTF